MSYKVSTLQLMGKDERISMRIAADDLSLLRSAAKESGVSLSEFLIDGSVERAQEILCDRTEFVLDPASWDAMIEAVETPPRELPKLRELFERTRAK